MHASAPSFEAAYRGDYIRSGQQGGSIDTLKGLLHQMGFDVDIKSDVFDARTERAVRAFQRAAGIQVDGIVGPQTLGALARTATSEFGGGDWRQLFGLSSRRAPRLGAQAPRGTVSAGSLAQSDSARINARRARRRPADTTNRTRAPQGTNAIRTPVPTSGPADARLAALQSQSLEFAQGELAAGVRENGSSNRSARVDQYARNAGMPVGGEWCAYFVNYAYSQTANANGGEFSGQRRLHSYQKNYAYFSYGNYTARDQRGAIAAGRSLREEHAAQGSTRRYMAIDGSRGQRYAAARDLPHETYRDHRELPIREGDTALFQRGHVGMVRSYNPDTGILVTVEGNAGNRVREKRYDLSDPQVMAQFDGFGRPALGDLVQP